MDRLSEQDLVDMTRYEALSGLLEVAGQGVKTMEEVELNAAIAEVNITILEFFQDCELLGLSFSGVSPEYGIDACDCVCECDETAPRGETESVDSLDDAPWLFLVSNDYSAFSKE